MIPDAQIILSGTMFSIDFPVYGELNGKVGRIERSRICTAAIIDGNLFEDPEEAERYIYGKLEEEDEDSPEEMIYEEAKRRADEAFHPITLYTFKEEHQ